MHVQRLLLNIVSRLFLTKFCPSKYIFHASMLQNTCITNYNEKQNVLDNLAKIFRYKLYFLLNFLCCSSESTSMNFFLTQFVNLSYQGNFIQYIWKKYIQRYNKTHGHFGYAKQISNCFIWNMNRATLLYTACIPFGITK